MNEHNNDFLAKLFKYPLLIVLIIGIITIFFALQLPKAQVDNNNLRFVPENDEARLTNKYIDDNFDSSLFILVALERKYGDVFDAAFLNQIREFNRRMEDFEIVGNVNSLVSADYIYAEGDSIIVQKLAGEDFSGTPAEIAALKQRLLSWDIYHQALISDDFKATQILIPLTITGEQASQPEIIDSFVGIRDIAKEMFNGYGEVYVTGIPIISATINEAMNKDLVITVPIVILVVLLILSLSFRKILPVVLPLITVLVAVVWSMGAMPLFGIKLSVVSTVLPVILVAVGSAYSIHIVTHYLMNLKSNAEMNFEEHRDYVFSIVRKIGKPVFLAALTTMAGFFSFCFTSVIPLREFGIFATFGVLTSFLMAVTLVPALLIIRGPRRVTSAGETTAASWNAAPVFVNITQKKRMVIFVALIVVLFSIWGVSKVVMDNIFVEYFKASTDIARSDLFIREKFGGSKIVNVVVEADSTEALLMPEVLSALDGLGIYLENNVSEAGKVLGFTHLVKRINQVFNVDESPHGLTPTRSAFADDSAFGFGDFGFGDFGFGFFDDIQTDEVAHNADSFDVSGISAQDEEPDKINAVDLVAFLREAASASRSTGRSMDVNSLVREMEKLINYEGAAYYEIPTDPERYAKTSPEELSQLVSNYLILLSGNIGSYANDPLTPTSIKSTIQLRTLGNIDTGRAVDSIREYIDAQFPDDVKTIIGGTALVETSLNNLVVESQIISLLISLVVVFLIVAVSNRSIVAGFVGIIPLTICLLITFAVMGFAGIKLNIGTSMMASLCVGIGIDYTIHCIEAYKREYRAAGGKGDFLLKTFISSGRAIIINAVSVGAGFAVLLFSQFVMLQDLGLLIAITMGSSALVSLTVIPVLLQILNPKFIRKELV